MASGFKAKDMAKELSLPQTVIIMLVNFQWGYSAVLELIYLKMEENIFLSFDV